MENLEEIKVKLKKLIDHAESAKQIGNLAEAELFASKVQDLLLKYNLSKKEIIEHQEELEVSGIDTDTEVKKAHGNWMAILLNTLCEYNFCKAIFTSSKMDKQYQITIIGSYENVEVVSYLYDVLKNQLQRLSTKAFSERVKEFQKNSVYQLSELLNMGIPMGDIKKLKNGMCTVKRPWKYSKSFPNRSKFLKSFYMGANSGILKKLEADKVKSKQSEFANQINALVLVHKNAVDKYMAENHDGIGTTKVRTRKVDGKAYYEGQKAGENSSMAKGLSNGDSVATQMLN